MGIRSIVSPRLAADLVGAGHYPQTVTIQAATRTRDSYGDPRPTWANVTGMIALPAAIAPAGGSEPSSSDGTWSVTSTLILVAGVWPIEAGQRAVGDDGRVWDIQAVDSGPHGGWTNLHCQTVQAGG